MRNKQFLDDDITDSAINSQTIHEQAQLEKLMQQNHETMQMMAVMMRTMVVNSPNHLCPI